MASDGLGSARDIGRRLLVTLGALFIYRLGCQIPLAGLDLGILTGAPGASSGSLSIFALGVMPIFSVTMIAEIAKMAFPALGRWAQLRRAILIAALALAAVEAFGLANVLERFRDRDPVAESGWPFFHLATIATLVAATALLGWLAERITRQGLGDGLWLLLIAPFLVRLPRSAVFVFELSRMGAASPSITSVPVGYCLLAGALIIPFTLTRYAPAVPPVGGDDSQSRADSGDFMDIWPPLLAYSVGTLLISVLLLAPGQKLNAPSFAVGAPLHLLIIAALIAGFAYLRAPRGDAAVLPAILAALAQIAICCTGELLSLNLGLPFAIDGMWLIVVIVTLTRVATRIIGRPVL